MLAPLLSLLGLALALRGVDLAAAARSLLQANPFLAALAVLCGLLSTVASAARWRLLLWPHSPRLGDVVGSFFVSQLANTTLPGKPGVALRAVIISRESKLPTGLALGSVAIERVLDSAIIALLCALLLLLLPVPAGLADIGRDSVLLALPVLAALLAAVALKPHLSRSVVAHLPPRPAALLARMLDALDALRRPDIYAPLLGYSLLVWLLGLAVNHLALLAMGIAAPWWTAFLLLAALQVGAKIPSTAANIGVFHYVAVLVLTGLQVDRSLAFSYAFLLHAIVFLPPAIAGAWCLARFGLRWSEQ